MMERLLARGEAIAAEAEARTIARAAEEIGQALPDVAVTTAAGGLVLVAPGLSRRMAEDPALRWIGSLMR